MPIDLITGQPGHGKTLRMMQRLLAESAKTGADRRFLVNAGIEGLAAGLVDLDLADSKLWNAVDFTRPGTCMCHDGTGQCLDAEGLPRKVKQGTATVDNPQWKTELDAGRPHAHLIPDGALIFVDEAWKDFGHLADASRGATPSHVLALAEHRHRALDFVWTTQMVNQLYPFVRGLIGSHSHVVRKFGSSICTVYSWGELNEDVKSATQREKAVTETWVHPTKTVGASYKSATGHTIKAKWPWKILLIPLCILGAIAVFWWVYVSMKQPGGVVAPDADGVAVAADAVEGKERLLTAAEYAAQFLPRIPGIHGSEPIYGDREAKSVPATYCVIFDAGRDQRCTCYTEQATPVLDVLQSVCYSSALHGAYDPFKAPFEAAPQGSPPEPAEAVEPLPVLLPTPLAALRP